jgi:hypothetical protein
LYQVTRFTSSGRKLRYHFGVVVSLSRQEEIMGLLAKLITLTALQTQDRDGSDELVMSRGDGAIFERISLRRKQEFAFDESAVRQPG